MTSVDKNATLIDYQRADLFGYVGFKARTLADLIGTWIAES
jgi:hypothetical protein